MVLSMIHLAYFNYYFRINKLTKKNIKKETETNEIVFLIMALILCLLLNCNQGLDLF